MPGYEIKIIDVETHLAVGPNVIGECYVRGAEVSPGYLNNDQANADSYTEDGFFKTGDAMYYDEEGFFYVVDRLKDVIKVDTQQVAPQELESILLGNDSVAEAAVVGIPDDDHGQIPKAYVVLKSGLKSMEDQLRRELIFSVNKEVGEWKQLRGGIDFLDSLPKIGVGKVDRRALKAIAGHSNFH